MPEQDDLSPANRELEAALRSLAPANAKIDPVAAAFAAGQRTQRRQVRVWQSAAAALLVCAAASWVVPFGLGAIRLEREMSTPAIAVVRQPATVGPLSDQSWAALRANMNVDEWDDRSRGPMANGPTLRAGDRL